MIARFRAWRVKRAALRCIKAMHARLDERTLRKDDVFLSAEAWLWTLAGEDVLAGLLIDEIKGDRP